MAKVIGKKIGINEKAKKAMIELERDMKSESRWAAIQALIPLGLKAVEEELQREIIELVGERYSRGGEVKRWGENPGSVFLGDQKVSVMVPRARNLRTNTEVQLRSYEGLQSPQLVDDMALSRVIHGMSQRNYEKAAVHVPETFGIKKTSVCRRFIRASAKKLQEFTERDLSSHDIVAIFIDGKWFAENEIVIALGVTIEGAKVLLGFVETGTENQSVCREFLRSLMDRGLNLESEILFIVDGGKGLYKGIKDIMGGKAVIQRCQWHKRENVVSYLDKKHQDPFRKKLQSAYQQTTYEKAKKRLQAIRRELQLINQSAVSSLDEGFEETLTLHKLGLFVELGESFKTTNCIENVNRQLGAHTDRVDRWQNSNQRQRWVATAMMEIEPRLRTVKGHKFLKELRISMKKLNQKEIQTTVELKRAS
ncbi:MAG: transposase [Bdellovibrionaceae bacterium]|nr:transposase [Pseudobdellovibrionaceae bacterium]